MNWQDERWIKLYTRDTGDWLFLSFDAQALFLMLLRKVDRHGRLALGKRGTDAIPQIVGHVQPEAVTRVTGALAVLIEDGCVVVKGEHLIIPNFEDAQEALTSNAERQRRHKEKVRAGNAVTLPKTRGNEQNRTEQTRTDQNRTEEKRKKPLAVTIADPAEANTFPTPPTAGRTVQTRLAYESAFQERWGVAPLTGKKLNGQLARFLDVVGVETGPPVAAFYVRHNHALYVNAKHPIDLLLRDAQKLHTEWKNGKAMTGTEARQIERTQANGDGWTELLKEKPA